MKTGFRQRSKTLYHREQIALIVRVASQQSEQEQERERSAAIREWTAIRARLGHEVLLDMDMAARNASGVGLETTG